MSTKLRGRALVRTDYAQEMGLRQHPGQAPLGHRAWSSSASSFPFMLTDDLLLILTLGMISAVGAIGLNLVTGYAGQVSLGHAFFIGIGAYTGAILGGNPDGAAHRLRAADLDLAAGRRCRRGDRRSARRTDRRTAAWSLPRHRHARPGVPR